MTSRLNDVVRPRENFGFDTESDDDVEAGTDEGPSKFMAAFFGQVDEVKDGITAIKKAARRVRAITDERAYAVSHETEERLSRELGPLVERTNVTVRRTKNLLTKIAAETDAQRGAVKASEHRIRENLANTLTRKFGDVCREYQREQQRQKAEIEKTVTRQLRIVKPDVSPAEIKGVMRSGSSFGEVLGAAIRNDRADPVGAVFADAQDKYQDVLRLEQSVAELHQMFIDFALLTEQQGELLDQIEYQVKSAGEYIEDGNVDIKYAIQYQAEIRKKQCCLCVCVLIIVVVLLAVLDARTGFISKQIKRNN
mmetsp:Transcript_24210/g.72638  ORF Transcript_24210/g.72638 Transcript_24210/m.72638 type:complete len:310 (+) Transcript_24210:187-1116(+)